MKSYVRAPFIWHNRIAISDCRFGYSVRRRFRESEIYGDPISEGSATTAQVQESGQAG
jgi:hypothetical protein